MSSESSAEDDFAMRRQGVERMIRDALQGLAIDAQSQLALNAGQIHGVEELAFAFELSFVMANANCIEAFTQIQWESLRAIDRNLNTMSLGGDEFEDEIWTDKGLRSHAAWAEIRGLARTALERFGWPCEPPLNRMD